MSDTKRTGRKRVTRRMGPPEADPETLVFDNDDAGSTNSSAETYTESSYGGVHMMQGMDLSEPLSAPTPLAPGAMRLVALGGVSEIGRNMMTYEYDGRILLCDCGVLFPSSSEPGIDLILPDFGYLEDRLDDIEALVLTHGHEDHIGAIPFLLKLRPDIPIVGSEFTNALVKAKCEEHRLHPHCTNVTGESSHNAGPFTVEFFHVNHSIPGALGVVVKSPAGVVVQTGDIKVDQTPKDNLPTDLPALSRFGDDGIDLMLVDSTNATHKGLAPSEAEIEPALRRLIRHAEELVVVACFASNVTRVQMVADAAVSAHRKLALSGRSMIRNMAIARDMGLFTISDDDLIDAQDINQYRRDEVVVMTTGTQGEAMAGLARMARSEHRQVSLHDGDTVIMSSSVVPGNEEAVFGMLNTLAQRGIKVITNHDANIHVSGHGYATDLLFLYNAARPSNVMPVHGEWRHLRYNRDLAVSTGVAPDRVVFAANGVCVDLFEGRLSIAGQVPVGHLYVDGLATGDISGDVLADRAILGEGGFIAATVVVDRRSGQPLATPQVIGKGFTDEPDALDDVPELVEKALRKLAKEAENDPYRMAQTVRRTVGKWVAKKWRRRPMIVPTVIMAEPPQE